MRYYYRDIEKIISIYLLIISLISIHCEASNHQNEEEKRNSDSGVHESISIDRLKRSSNLEHPVRNKRYENESIGKMFTEREIIQNIFGNDYDWRVRPAGLNKSIEYNGGPVKVTVNMYLRSISKIDEVNMEYSTQFTFRESWVDPRLAYTKLANEWDNVPNFIVLAPSDKQIWMPDTFFQNEKDAKRHTIDKPNMLIRIYPDGAILYSVRLSMVLSCPMSLEYYPMDEQRCLIDLASYAYTTDDILYVWKDETPIQQKDGLGRSMPNFELMSVKTDYCTSKTNTGTYSCLRTQLWFRREFDYYLLHLFVPSILLVIVSWVSFWVDKDSAPARVTLGVTTLLTMTTQASGINAKLPPVGYIKAIDVWIGACLVFIFGALLEYALVNYAARQDKVRSGRRTLPTVVDPASDNLSQEQSNGSQMMNPLIKNQQQLPLHHHQQQQTPRYRQRNFFPSLLSNYKERSKRIDIVSRVVFPIAFLIFNIVFWTVYKTW